MRILHTSDWHLGRGLHGVSLYDAQESALNQIIDLVEKAGVDVVVIAGDVYDRGIPPLESVGLLNRALGALCAKVPVIMTAGNHDSPQRLGFGAELYGDRLHIRSAAHEVDSPIVLSDEHGEVAFYAFTYLDPDEARHILTDDEAPLPRTHEAVMSAACTRALRDAASRGLHRTVAVAHAFVVGGERSEATTSDSERDITVGTVDCLPSAVFDGFTYVALGHLHGRQRPAATSSGTVLEYSGSPLKYSFSEEKHAKSVSIVDIDANGVVTTSAHGITQPREMARIRGSIDELCDPHGPFARHRQSWVQVTVTDYARPENMISRLNDAFPYALIKQHESAHLLTADRVGTSVSRSATPTEIVTGFFTEVIGQTPPAEELAMVEPLIKQAFEGKR